MEMTATETVVSESDIASALSCIKNFRLVPVSRVVATANAVTYHLKNGQCFNIRIEEMEASGR